MRTIILGREKEKCNQAFPIKEDVEGVSRVHAQITINDNNDWYLEDLGSSNGTFVRDENTGELVPVTRKRMITPMTFIVLGPDNSKGCSFFAKQADNYGDFSEERQYLLQKDEEFDEKLKQIEKSAKMQSAIKAIFPVLMLTITMIIFPDNTSQAWIGRGLGTVIPSLLFLWLYNPADKKNELKGLREKFSHCPNPCCSNKQTSKEIRNMRCSKCKK